MQLQNNHGQKKEIELDPDLSLELNLDKKYNELKELKKKLNSLESKRTALINKNKPSKKEHKERKEQSKQNIFYKFITSNNKVIYAGRNAHQNDILFSRFAKANDLLFHADIIGASLILLKEGKKSDSDEKAQAAQIAACYSNAWKLKSAVIDVYSFLPEQVEKAASGLYLQKGSFIITGKKEWYKNVELKLKIGILRDDFCVFPYSAGVELIEQRIIVPGNIEKEDFCQQLSKIYNFSSDYISKKLPAGKMNFLEEQ
ncbi:MAG: NFACT RNA binding domain-containing protein [Candidatus Micrarchaeota archaeon]|nr:NFACT RNA binding domain-containing protein [Candidatus Micrarchaeota archaeon]